MGRRKRFRILLPAIALVLMGAAPAAGGVEPALVLGGLAIILVAAKLAGDLFVRINQPPVLGELLAGVAIGALPLLGFDGLRFVYEDHTMRVIAEIGVVFLLFEVGLESNIGQMLRVGASSFLVASAGVIAPMGLGFLVAAWAIPDEPWHAHLFIGAILTATSVGITARVLKDLQRIDSTEGRIILGAAVIDDVLGLIVLAVVQGIVLGASTGGGLSAQDIVIIIAKAVVFLGGAMLLGGRVSRHLFGFATRMRVRGLLLAIAIAFCFGLAWLAHAVGLAPIVGAFAAGLVLDEVQYRDLSARDNEHLETLIRPIAAFLVPVFFVVTGARVDLRVFTDPSILGFAGLLTLAAILGKQVCALAVVERGLDRLSVGIGMIPRGEVGLIFAAVGAKLVLPDGRAVVDDRTYAAAVVMVIVTTLVTPPVLAWSLRRRG